MQLPEFLKHYGDTLAHTIAQRCTPVYNPLNPTGVATFREKLSHLLRKPLPVQEEIILGLAKALYTEGRQRLFLVGEMGTGKTMMALSVISLSPRPLRVLVVCPPHLVQKWMREAMMTLPDVEVVDCSVRQVLGLLQTLRETRQQRPERTTLSVISRERLKLSYGWRPAAVQRRGTPSPSCPDCGVLVQDGHGYLLSWEHLAARRQICHHCGTPLWQADPSLRRYAPTAFITRYLKGYFDLLILDEVQEYKAGRSLQGQAMGALLRVIPSCLCLTGTLNGGYADDLFYLLFHLDPARLLADGYSYTSVQQWLETYGTLEYVRKVTAPEHYYGRGKRPGALVRKRPGVSPLVIGRYVLDRAAFVRLQDVSDTLPPYAEEVQTVPMLAVQESAYTSLEADLRQAVTCHGSRMLSSALQALLCYPDSCGIRAECLRLHDPEETIIATAPQLFLTDVLPKEALLRHLITQEQAAGRKTLVYLWFTQTRDLRPRVQAVLEAVGCRVGILDVTVEPKKREAWLRTHVEDLDVLVVHPELVKTGLDLCEFPTVVFYQVGYHLFTLRQAARRSWRIGQTQPVRVLFLAYQHTMQETALTLMARKLEVALTVEGDLPAGLAEYAATGVSLFQELGKALVHGEQYAGAEAAWTQLRQHEHALRRPLPTPHPHPVLTAPHVTVTRESYRHSDGPLILQSEWDMTTHGPAVQLPLW